ncbi:MAG TPA: NTP transferase domain-containing protein, partial [bacterium]|nr:NTP transferase domain-containing protein [bacterium]
MPRFAAVVLAAGQSTRLKSKRSKVLHMLSGRPVVSYPIEAARRAGAERIVVVRGPAQEDLKLYLKGEGLRDVVQK